MTADDRKRMEWVERNVPIQDPVLRRLVARVNMTGFEVTDLSTPSAKKASVSQSRRSRKLAAILRAVERLTGVPVT